MGTQLYATCGPATARHATNTACSRTSSLSPERRSIIGSILSRLFIKQGSGEWGVGSGELELRLFPTPHSPLPTPASLLPHSPLGAWARFDGRFYRRGGVRLERVLV